MNEVGSAPMYKTYEHVLDFVKLGEKLVKISIKTYIMIVLCGYLAIKRKFGSTLERMIFFSH